MNVVDIAGVIKANAPKLVEKQIAPLKKTAHETTLQHFTIETILRELDLEMQAVAIRMDAADSVVQLEARVEKAEHRAQRHAEHLGRLESKVKGLRDGT